MSESKHTSGPWRVCGGFTAKHRAIHSDAGYIVFGMADAHEDSEGIPPRPIQAPDYETQNANARRIVACVNACEGINPEAVPDLLEACKAALDEFENHINPALARLCQHPFTITPAQLRAAITKATGGETDR